MSTDGSLAWLKSYPEGIKWDVEIDERPLFSLLDEAENHYPDKPALDFLGKKTSYRMLAASVRRLAAGLQELGVRPGVNVGIFMPNCPQFIISYYAILKAGGTVVNYNPLYSVADLCHQIDDSATEIMITLSLNVLYPKVAACLGKTRLRKIIAGDFAEVLPLAKRLAFRLTHRKDIAKIPQNGLYVSFASLMKEGREVRPVTIHPDTHVAVLQYTGGTTGVPKGAVLTHANLYANAVQCGMWFSGLRHGEEIILAALPLFHVFAMTAVMNLAIHTGSQIILHPKFDLKAILYDIHFKHPTLMPGVPTMFAALNNYPRIDKYDLSSLKMCFSGGAPLPQEVKEVFEKRAGCKLVEGYGLSETSPVVAGNPLFGINKPGSIGIPFPATRIQIEDMHGSGKVMAVKEIGEICVSGPQVMQGYLHQFEENRGALKDGFFHTGDLGYMDEDGYFFVVDRIKEMIISGGYKIYPRHLEEILYRHEDVLEAAAIGVPHPERGQVVKLFIAPKEGRQISEADMKSYLKDKVSGYSMPHHVEFRTSLPKSAIGKILKKILVEEENRRTVK